MQQQPEVHGFADQTLALPQIARVFHHDCFSLRAQHDRSYTAGDDLVAALHQNAAHPVNHEELDRYAAHPGCDHYVAFLPFPSPGEQTLDRDDLVYVA